MRRRIAVYGATEEVLALLPALARHPDLELAAVFDPEARQQRRRLALLDPACAAVLQRTLTDDPGVLAGDPALAAVIDAGIAPSFRARFPAADGPEVLTPAQARDRWPGAPPPPGTEPTGAEGPERSPRDELLDALAEIAESADLADDPDALFARLLDTTLAVTGATRGSLLTFDAASDELRVRAAVGLEPALWPAVRLRLGDGVAGRAAAERRPLVVRGRADPSAFQLARERFDAASALIVPLFADEALIGVLCLHHPALDDLFGDGDLRFAADLGRLAARLGARALAAEAQRRELRSEAAAREARGLLQAPGPPPGRLVALCRLAAAQAGGGSAELWLNAPERADLGLAASSLAGGARGGDARLAPGEGLDGRAASSGAPIVLRRDDAFAYAALPLRSQGAAVGVLVVQAGEAATPARDVEAALAAIAAVAGRELDRIAREERGRTRVARGEALHEAALRVLALRDAEEIARFAADFAAFAFEADLALVRLRAGTRFSVRAQGGSAPEPLRAELFALDRAAAREALRRRAPVGERDVAGAEGRALLTVPLRGDGAALGTLGIYGRRERGFGAEDRAWIERLAGYVGRALERALAGDEAARAPAPVDAELERRLASALARGEPLAVVSCWLENERELRARGVVDRVLGRVREGVRAHLGARDFAADGEHGVLALVSTAGASGAERIARLARAVAEHVMKDSAADEGPRAALAFGYALHPEDGDRAQALLERAGAPRIRML